MAGLFRKRRTEHRHDEEVRQSTADALVAHRDSMKRVRSALTNVDESIAEEIRRLDAAIERGAHA